MADNPPPEFFLAAYFRAKQWWSPPERASDAPAGQQFEPTMSPEAFEAWERSFAVQD
jgi:hypothetical protein